MMSSIDTTAPLFEAKGLTLSYGDHVVLDGVDLRVDPGEILALVGPNGAGKSTLLGIVAGDVTPDAGTVEIAGQALGAWKLRDLARVRSMLTQEHRVAFPFPVYQVVEMGRAPWRGLPEEDDDEQVIAEAMAATEVTHLASRSFGGLSGGEKGRTSFARVLAQAGTLLLLDEPTAALDIGHQEAVLAQARAAADAGAGVVVVLHDLSLAAAWADRVALLHGGHTVAQGTPAEVLTGPRLSATYDYPVDVLSHPTSGELMIVPDRRAAAATRSVVALTLTALLLTLFTALAPSASAAPRIDVRNSEGSAVADTRFSTKFTVNASGFQSVKNGFGGVYVMFGWVRQGAWKPSQGGTTGADYRYVPDSESEEGNKGYLRFVSFPGSKTSGQAATTMSDSGSFRVELTVPGPVFNSVDRGGNVIQVDCREVTCGIITIGAHGVKSPANESFTPVRFGEVFGEGEQPPADQGGEPTAAGPTTSEAPAEAAPAGRTTRHNAKAAAPVAALTTDRTTAVAGNTLVFTATGLQPGESVVAVLDDGAVALGPMRAGDSGEIAGAMQLPLELAAGTHELRVTGAASGTQLSERFAIQARPDADPTAETEQAAATTDEDLLPVLVLAGAALLFALALITAARRLRNAEEQLA